MAHDSHPSGGDSDEPKSPLWLPALGAALFLLAGIWWVTRTPEPKPPAVIDADAAVVSGDAAGGDAGAAPPPPAAEAH
jgi:hypothetical protein